MTLQEKLGAMNTVNTTIFLESHDFGEEWTCALLYKEPPNRTSNFELRSKPAKTIETAVDAVYCKFMELTETAFKNARPAQLTYTASEPFDVSA